MALPTTTTTVTLIFLPVSECLHVPTSRRALNCSAKHVCLHHRILNEVFVCVSAYPILYLAVIVWIFFGLRWDIYTEFEALVL